MRTIVYVDGFNLYYGCLKNTRWKWLDLVALSKGALQLKHEIVGAKYFTARVPGTPADPAKPQRQDVYLQALQHFRPEVEVYFGHFRRHKVRMPLADRTDDRRTAEVLKTEEKGSDVNLAVHLLERVRFRLQHILRGAVDARPTYRGQKRNPLNFSRFSLNRICSKPEFLSLRSAAAHM